MSFITTLSRVRAVLIISDDMTSLNIKYLLFSLNIIFIKYYFPQRTGRTPVPFKDRWSLCLVVPTISGGKVRHSHKHLTNTLQTPHKHLTNTLRKPYKHLTNTSQNLTILNMQKGSVRPFISSCMAVPFLSCHISIKMSMLKFEVKLNTILFIIENKF